MHPEVPQLVFSEGRVLPWGTSEINNDQQMRVV